MLFPIQWLDENSEILFLALSHTHSAYISHFSCCCKKIPDKGSVRNDELIRAYSLKAQSIMVGKSRQLSQMHPQPGVKERWMDVGTQLTFLFFSFLFLLSLETQAYSMMSPMFRVRLETIV